MVYFQRLSASATAGNTVYDDGLRSTTENPKTLLSILVQVTEKPEASSMLQVWYEKELIAEIPLTLLDSHAQNVDYAWSKNRLNEIEIGFAVPVGAVVRLAAKAVTNTQTIVGAYRYEITG
jgi:hypothetical protein